VKAGLIPKEISAFGVTSDVNRHGLLVVLTGVTVYFLVAFLVYAYADFVTYQYGFQHAVGKRMAEFNESHDDYKFMGLGGGKALMPAYIPRSEQYEQLFALQAKMGEMVGSFASQEVERLMLERSHA
jgi:hypothetical protein